MSHVIVTSRTLLWTLLTVATALSMLAAVITPAWLVGAPKRPLIRGRLTGATMRPPQLYKPSIGLYNRCVKLHQIDELFTDNCAPFVSSLSMPSDEFPSPWKAGLAFFAGGLALMAATVLSSVLGCCVRSVLKKSIFTVSGTVQAIAGLMFLLGLLLYPAGWGSRRVHTVCGPHSEPFMLGGCSLGDAGCFAFLNMKLICGIAQNARFRVINHNCFLREDSTQKGQFLNLWIKNEICNMY